MRVIIGRAVAASLRGYNHAAESRTAVYAARIETALRGVPPEFVELAEACGVDPAQPRLWEIMALKMSLGVMPTDEEFDALERSCSSSADSYLRYLGLLEDAVQAVDDLELSPMRSNWRTMALAQLGWNPPVVAARRPLYPKWRLVSWRRALCDAFMAEQPATTGGRR